MAPGAKFKNVFGVDASAAEAYNKISIRNEWGIA
jgi:hypothetical protein